MKWKGIKPDGLYADFLSIAAAVKPGDGLDPDNLATTITLLSEAEWNSVLG